MSDKKIINTIILTVGIIIAALIVAMAFENIPGTNVTSTGEVQRNTISVVGESQIEVEPDKAEIYVQVETRADSADDASDENSEISNKVINALKRAEIDNEDIETDSYNIYPRYDWDEGYDELVGYAAEHTLRITTTDMDKVGNFLDTAIDAGANEIQRVDFGLSQDKEKEVYSEALVRASGLAEEKASSVSAALGVRLGDVVSVVESSAGYRPSVYYDYAVEERALAATTPIAPEKVTVEGYVTLVYEIK